ncbi:C2H2 type zinc finger domain-containing protein [Ferroplasma sp.]|uniref:C2H2 type zinc finger domain-containing protein n=1 Tax=Ferroplasma sp. TaxID=2591003 RepID=UPI0026042A23|nr:C2H2 type zinc finger domain-containing protein [Ferroplasma sp.]
MAVCPVCNEKFDYGDYYTMAIHFINLAKDSDSYHVQWINRNISRERIDVTQFTCAVENFYNMGHGGIKEWIINIFVDQFRGENPHPFILKMQSYSKPVMMGYAVEHYFFLKQWVKSCSITVSKTDLDDVQRYEIENILSEYYGIGRKKPHIELLLEMGEELGIDRTQIYATEPLNGTKFAISRWKDIANKCNWICIMAAMHSLELIANRRLNNYGAKYSYFNPEILESPLVPDSVKKFLGEGYRSDDSHSFRALDIIAKYCHKYNIESIQDAYLMSAYAFDRYLEARLERGEMFEN